MLRQIAEDNLAVIWHETLVGDHRKVNHEVLGDRALNGWELVMQFARVRLLLRKVEFKEVDLGTTLFILIAHRHNFNIIHAWQFDCVDQTILVEEITTDVDTIHNFFHWNGNSIILF